MAIADICNRALVTVGVEGSISALSDTSIEGRACNLLYDVSRREMLRADQWSFARKIKRLAGYTPSSGYTASHPVYSEIYDYPADALRILAVLVAGGSSREYQVDYVVEIDESVVETSTSDMTMMKEGSTSSGKVILADTTGLNVRYVKNVEDTNAFDDLFRECLEIYLASKLASYFQNPQLAEVLRLRWRRMMDVTSSISATEDRETVNRQAPWIEARKAGGPLAQDRYR